MIIGLTTLIIMLFSNGPGEIFLIPEVDKKIKEVVVDKDRQKEAILLFKSTKKQINKYHKAENKISKKLKKEKYRSSLSPEQVEQLLSESYERRKEIQAYLVEQRLQIRQVMQKDEWDNLINISKQELVDNHKKLRKANAKRDKEAEKVLSNIRLSLLDISNEENRKMALVDYSNFEESVNQLFEESRSLTIDNNQEAQSYDVSEEEIMNIYTSLNNARNTMHSEYFQMRTKMISYLDEDQWNAISKSFIKLLNQ